MSCMTLVYDKSRVKYEIPHVLEETEVNYDAVLSVLVSIQTTSFVLLAPANRLQ